MENQIWAMEHVLFGHNKLAKTKICLHRILHLMHVKVGEAEVVKAFSSNEVIIEVYVSKEEMSTEIVKEALDGYHNARVKDNLHWRSIADIVPENVALRAIIVDQEVSIAKLEKVSKSEKDDDISADDVGNSNSKEHYMLEKDLDMEGDDVGKIYIEKLGEVLGDEEMDIQNSDMYTRLKAQPRKHAKNVSLKTPWTRLGRKNRRRIE
ncbi:hypothetical protein V8G54_008641 [Vigna mungo]|uniref:Uncharacterized protein n=1 Tax=Vigna mungo TaxID=3915 RepID=A0AAQ3SA84_VIGMU